MDLMVFREITHWWELNSFDIGFGITLIIINFNKIRLVIKNHCFSFFYNVNHIIKKFEIY